MREFRNQTRRDFLKGTGILTALSLGLSLPAAGQGDDEDETIYTEANTPSRDEYDWNQTVEGRCYIYSRKSERDDAVEVVRDELQRIREVVGDRLPLNTAHEVEVYIHPDAGGQGLVNIQVADSTYKSVQLVLPPWEEWAEREEYRKWVARAATEGYAEVVVHRVVTNSVRGWTTATRFFKHGVVHHIAHYGRDIELSKVSTARSRLAHDGIAPFKSDSPLSDSIRRWPHGSGAVFVDFLVDEWGWEHIQTLLSTRASDLSAVASVFNVSGPTLNRRWLQWLNDSYGADYDLSSGITPTPTPTPTPADENVTYPTVEGGPPTGIDAGGEQSKLLGIFGPDFPYWLAAFGGSVVAGVSATYLVADSILADDDAEDTDDAEGDEEPSPSADDRGDVDGLFVTDSDDVLLEDWDPECDDLLTDPVIADLFDFLLNERVSLGESADGESED